MLCNANLSQLQKKIESSKSNYLSVYFAGKPFVKIVFHIFQCLVAQKKPGQWKTIFGQRKTLIKIMLIFCRLFSKKKFWKTIFLSYIASSINIIFVYSREKHNFLAHSLSHGKFFHFFSLSFAFSLLTPLLSLTLVSHLPIDLSLSLSLLSFLHVSLPFYNTII